MRRFWREPSPAKLALDQQRELLKRERRLADDIKAMAVTAAAAVQARIEYFQKQIEAAISAGTEPAEWWLYESGRLDALQAQWQAWAESLSSKGPNIVNLAKLDVVNLGAAHAQSMATAIGTTFQALPRHALAIILDNTSDGKPLAERFLRAGEAAAVRAREAVVQAMTIGVNPRQLGKELTGILNTSKVNAQVIARTETLRAYRQVSVETYRLNGDVSTGWRWLATMDSRTCPICLAMHGSEHKHTEPFISHPVCRCTTVPVVDGVEYGQNGQELFDAMSFDERVGIYGPVKARLLTELAIPIRSIVLREDNEWGGTLKEMSLSQMIERGLITREQVAGAALAKAA